MAKQTAKYVAAVQKARELGIQSITGEPGESLYPKLAAQRYAWEPDRGTWEQTNLPVNTQGAELKSMFMDGDGLPSGTFRLRVMCHPQDVAGVAALLKERLGPIITEVADKVYENRKGPGVRIYLTCKLPTVKARGRLRRMAEDQRREREQLEDYEADDE